MFGGGKVTEMDIKMGSADQVEKQDMQVGVVFK